MRLTSPLRHVKHFHWGKGWPKNSGTRARKDTDNFVWRRIWARHHERPLETVEQVLPPGVTPLDPNKYLKDEFAKEIRGDKDSFIEFTLPWPYSKRPVKGTVEDPDYKQQVAYVYSKRKRIVEPANLPLHFANSTLEKGLPVQIQSLRDNTKIDESFVDLIKRKVNWSLNSDSQMRKLPRDRQFPYLDQNPPRVWGLTVNKKEDNLLQTIYDMCNVWTTKNYGFNSEVLLQRATNLYCNLPLYREGKLVVLKLDCNFVSLLSPSKTGMLLKPYCFDANFKTTTANKPLPSIYPVSWEVGFTDTNFYNADFDFQIPVNSSIQTIFLTNDSNVRFLKVEDLQGRSVMACYGYAVQEAKLKYKTDDVEQIVLNEPICIQCVYTIPADLRVGFVLFQLNTLKSTDDTVRNQAWFSEPKSLMDDTSELMAELVTIQSLGVHH